MVAVALLASIAACGGAASPSPTPARGIAEPWQPAPFTVAPDIIDVGITTCIEQRDIIPAQTAPVVVDTRGGGVMLVVFSGPGGQGECMLEFAADGAPRIKLSGGSPDGFDASPAPTEIAIYTSSTGLAAGDDGQPDAYGYVVGRAGDAVAAVDVEVATGERLRATTSSSGWFAAWWPGTSEFQRALAFDAAGAPIVPAN